MNQNLCSVPVLGFAAFSGTGKTTLLEKLISLLAQKNINIAVIKHAHHSFDIDHPDKDSYRLRKAGAKHLLISSRNRHALITETPEEEPNFHQLLARFPVDDIDLLLVEGFKKEAFPKIELHREALDKPWLFPDDKNIIAIASDTRPKSDLPFLDINQIDNILAFIERWLESYQASAAVCDDASSHLLSVEKAFSQIISAISFPYHSKLTGLADLPNKVLATDVLATRNIPPANNAAVDGFAIKSQDIENNCFTLVDEILAGQESEQTLQAGETMQIMTGAPLPEGADTVVMREQARLDKDNVSFDLSKGKIRSGQNVRLAGEDLKKGTQVLDAGERLTAAEIGMIASLGFPHINTYLPIKVAIFSTGDEVYEQGQDIPANCIYDSNRFTLHSQLKRLGCNVMDLGIIEDNEECLENTLIKASLEADLIISSGGVSVGNADYIRTVLQRIGQINFWRINMRPGRPLAFGHVNNKPFFGLPGNPVATMVTFLQFVEAAIRKLQGESDWSPTYYFAQCQHAIKSKRGRTEYIRGIFHAKEDGTLCVSSTGSQGSGILRSMSEANCLIIVAPQTEHQFAGDIVQIRPFH